MSESKSLAWADAENQAEAFERLSRIADARDSYLREIALIVWGEGHPDINRAWAYSSLVKAVRDLKERAEKGQPHE